MSMSSEQAANALGLLLGVQIPVSSDGYEGLVAQVIQLIEDKETAQEAAASRVLRLTLRRIAELEEELGDSQDFLGAVRDELREAQRANRELQKQLPPSSE